MKILSCLAAWFLILVLTAGCILPQADNAMEWTMTGESHHAVGKYEEAVAAYDHAIALDPTLGKAWRGRGLSLSMLNRTEEAEASLGKALSLDPSDMEALYFQALSRSRAGTRTGAMESLDQAVTINPQSRDEAIVLFQAWKLRGDMLAESGRPDEANVSYQKAHEVMMSTL